MIRRLTLLLIVAVGLVSCGRADADAIPNVRLGMAPRDVRDRFEPGGEGTWQTTVGASADDTAIEWKAKGDAGRVRDARFEFHLGMLVAMRARTIDPPPPDERISTTPKTVTVRQPAPKEEGGGTRVSVLARDCPTHKDEAERLAAKSK